jgi:hypothetical protein
MTVKVLLERTAPVLIDGFAVTALLKLVDKAVSSKASVDDSNDAVVDVPNRAESGMKLLLVSHLWLCSFGILEKDKQYFKMYLPCG